MFTVDEIKLLLIPVFQRYDIKQSILFGSCNKGVATPKSDIDLLVDSGLKRLRFIGLIEDIKKSPYGKDVDVFDITHIDSGSLVDREIRNTGVGIYSR